VAAPRSVVQGGAAPGVHRAHGRIHARRCRHRRWL